MVGPATFNIRLTGEIAQQGVCVPTETLMAGCGTRTIPNYTAGLLPSYTPGPGGELFATPTRFVTQRPADYSACGGAGSTLDIQPVWLINRFVGAPGAFTLASVPEVAGSGNTRARAYKVAGEKFLATRVGRTLVLRAQTAPRSSTWTGMWTATLKAKRIR